MALQERLSYNDRVFFGVVTSVQLYCEAPTTRLRTKSNGKWADMLCELPSGEMGGLPVRLVAISVFENFKGKSSEEVVRVELHSCGMDFSVGTAYVVYAKKHGGVLSTDLCSGTKRSIELDSSLEELRQGANNSFKPNPLRGSV